MRERGFFLYFVCSSFFSFSFSPFLYFFEEFNFFLSSSQFYDSIIFPSPNDPASFPQLAFSLFSLSSSSFFFHFIFLSFLFETFFSFLLFFLTPSFSQNLFANTNKLILFKVSSCFFSCYSLTYESSVPYLKSNSFVVKNTQQIFNKFSTNFQQQIPYFDRNRVL